MQQIYNILKSFIDPIFVIFILLVISLIAGRKKDGILFLFLTVIILYGLSIEPTSNYLSYQLEKDYIKIRPTEEKTTLDGVVALSGDSYDIHALGKTFLGESSTARVVHAVRMYKERKARYLVCSGKGDGKISDAAMMSQMAEDFGVPKDRIRVENQSANTHENAVQVSKMFADKNIRLGLVTSAYHMKRSEREFRKYFSNVLPLPAGYLYASPAGTVAVRYVPQSQRLFKNTLIFREYIGRLWYSIKDFQASTAGRK